MFFWLKLGYGWDIKRVHNRSRGESTVEYDTWAWVDSEQD